MSFRCVVLQEAILGGLAQILVHKLGVAPVPEGACGRVIIFGGDGFLELLGTACGDGGGGGTLLAHCSWARAAELVGKEARMCGNGSRCSKEEDGGGEWG
jgi:hypothetical protein